MQKKKKVHLPRPTTRQDSHSEVDSTTLLNLMGDVFELLQGCTEAIKGNSALKLAPNNIWNDFFLIRFLSERSSHQFCSTLQRLFSVL